MAKIKVVFLMHDVDGFNGAVTDRVDGSDQDGFQYPAGDDPISDGKTKEELCANLVVGSTNAKAAFDTKVHANADAAKSAMGVANVDVSDASSSAWALSGDGTELSVTSEYNSKADADSFQTKFTSRDQWATQGLVWQDKSKGVWDQ